MHNLLKWRDQERFDVKVPPKYVKEGTSSRRVLLRTSAGKDEMVRGLQLSYIYFYFGLS